MTDSPEDVIGVAVQAMQQGQMIRRRCRCWRHATAGTVERPPALLELLDAGRGGRAAHGCFAAHDYSVILADAAPDLVSSQNARPTETPI